MNRVRCLLTVAAVLVMTASLATGWVRKRVAPPHSAESAPVALFWGDSYFVGSRGVPRKRTLAYLSGTALGYETIVRGHYGTGFATGLTGPLGAPNFLGQVAAGQLRLPGKAPALVVIEGGIVDRFAPRAAVASNATAMFADVKRLYPAAQVVVVGPAEAAVNGRERIPGVETALASAAEKEQLPFVSFRRLMSRSQLLKHLSPDGLHPTLVGHKLLAARLTALLAGEKLAAKRPR